MNARTGIMIAEEANGVYRVLLEGLESAMALGLPTRTRRDERNRRAMPSPPTAVDI